MFIPKQHRDSKGNNKSAQHQPKNNPALPNSVLQDELRNGQNRSPQAKIIAQLMRKSPTSTQEELSQKLAVPTDNTSMLQRDSVQDEPTASSQQNGPFTAIGTIQAKKIDIAPLQAKVDTPKDKTLNSERAGITRPLPFSLMSGLENLSGHAMDDVRVHFQSSKPAQLQAHAFAQGNHIHLAPGQEQHLPHEAWHVVQQKQGRVKQNGALNRNIPINDDMALEREADVMGAKAMQYPTSSSAKSTGRLEAATLGHGPTVQRVALGVYSDAPTNTQELDTNDLVAIEAYVRANEAAGRQDLNRLLVYTVRKKDRANLINVQTIVNRYQRDSEKVQVAKTIHLIWVGDNLGAKEQENIEAIYASVHDKEGWQVILWTDSRKCGFLGGAARVTALAENPNFTIRRDLGNVVDARVKPTYDIALGKADTDPKGGFTMMSDLARYSILLQQGGIYMDVDLNLGDANVDDWDMTMSDDHSIPAFGPNIQYIGDMERNLQSGLSTVASRGGANLTSPDADKDDLGRGIRAAFSKMFTTKLEVATDVALPQTTKDQANTMDVMTSDEVLSEKTRIAAMVRYMKGDLSNNLVVAPKNQRFLNFMIGKIAEGLEKRGYDFNPGMVPAITGPMAFMPLMMEFYGEGGDPISPDSDVKGALTDPNWISQLVQVEWLTGVQKLKKEEEDRKAAAQQAQARPQRRGHCYITTACVTYMGMDDDCEALTLLRAFRDTYLLQKTNGQELIDLYYEHSPQIVSAIQARPDCGSILKNLYRVIESCVDAIKRGDDEFAYRTYCRMVVGLKEKYLPELTEPMPKY